MACFASYPVSQSLATLGFYRPAEKVSGSEIGNWFPKWLGNQFPNSHILSRMRFHKPLIIKELRPFLILAYFLLSSATTMVWICWPWIKVQANSWSLLKRTILHQFVVQLALANLSSWPRICLKAIVLQGTDVWIHARSGTIGVVLVILYNISC